MLDSIASMLAGPLAGTISKATGLPEGVVKMGVAAAIPALLGVLAKNAKDKNGAQALHGALERDHDGSVLQDLDGYVQQGGNLDDGDKILGHALGDRRSVAEQAIAEKAGMDLGQVSKLLPMLAMRGIRMRPLLLIIVLGPTRHRLLLRLFLMTTPSATLLVVPEIWWFQRFCTHGTLRSASSCRSTTACLLSRLIAELGTTMSLLTFSQSKAPPRGMQGPLLV